MFESRPPGPQELCRQHMASKSSLSRHDGASGGGAGGGSLASGSVTAAGAGGRRGTDTSRVSSVSSQFSDGPQHSPSSTHSSTPSWSEEPAQSNMDISTGHMILVSPPRPSCGPVQRVWRGASPVWTCIQTLSVCVSYTEKHTHTVQISLYVTHSTLPVFIIFPSHTPAYGSHVVNSQLSFDS